MSPQGRPPGPGSPARIATSYRCKAIHGCFGNGDAGVAFQKGETTELLSLLWQPDLPLQLKAHAAKAESVRNIRMGIEAEGVQ